VLIRCQLEVALVDLRNLSQARLGVLLGFVLHAAVLDEGSVVVSAIFTGDPTKFVDVACEVGRASGLKLISKTSIWESLSPIQSMTYFSLAFLRL